MSQIWFRYLPVFLQARIQGREYLQNIISNTGWLFFDNIIRIGGGLFVNVWVARYLGPAQFGLLDYVVAFVALFSAPASLGLESIVVRELVREPECREEILSSALAMKLVASFVSIIIIIITALLLRNGDRETQLLTFIVASGIFFQSFDTIDYWFQSQVQSKYTVFAKNSSFILISLVKIFLILNHASLISFALVIPAEIALGAFGLIRIFRRQGYKTTVSKCNFARCRSLLHSSWPVIIACLSIVIYMRIDQVMLGEMVGSEEVGIYSSAARLSAVWYFLPTVIVSSIFPFIMQAKGGNREIYHLRLVQLFSLMTFLAFLIIIPTTFFSDRLIQIVYGGAYAAAGPVLAVYIWACWFVFLGIAQDPWDVVENQTRLAMLRTLLGALINVVLNLIFIPSYGAMGATISTILSFAVSTIFLNAVNMKTREVFYLQLKSIFFLKYLR